MSFDDAMRALLAVQPLKGPRKDDECGETEADDTGSDPDGAAAIITKKPDT